jgi:predicted transcriptional regulator
MYSPRISEQFIPTLHHLARLRGQPMTVIVAEAIAQYVERQDLDPIADLIADSERRYGIYPAHRSDSPVLPVQ